MDPHKGTASSLPFLKAQSCLQLLLHQGPFTTAIRQEETTLQAEFCTHLSATSVQSPQLLLLLWDLHTQGGTGGSGRHLIALHHISSQLTASQPWPKQPFCTQNSHLHCQSWAVALRVARCDGQKDRAMSPSPRYPEAPSRAQPCRAPQGPSNYSRSTSSPAASPHTARVWRIPLPHPSECKSPSQSTHTATAPCCWANRLAPFKQQTA